MSNNTTYYVFTHAQDGSFEVHPVKEWYNFTPRATYKTLNAEEAEEKFEQRNKILNKWAMMVNKKVRTDGEGGEGEGDDDDDEGGGKVWSLSQLISSCFFHNNGCQTRPFLCNYGMPQTRVVAFLMISPLGQMQSTLGFATSLRQGG